MFSRKLLQRCNQLACFIFPTWAAWLRSCASSQWCQLISVLNGILNMYNFVCMFNFIEALSYIDMLWDIDAVDVEVRFRAQVFAQFQGTHPSIHSLWVSFLSFIAILCYTWVLFLDCVVISISFLFWFCFLLDSLSLTTKPELSHTILVLYLRRKSGLYRRINACLSYIFMFTWRIMSIDLLYTTLLDRNLCSDCSFKLWNPAAVRCMDYASIQVIT